MRAAAIGKVWLLTTDSFINRIIKNYTLRIYILQVLRISKIHINFKMAKKFKNNILSASKYFSHNCWTQII